MEQFSKYPQRVVDMSEIANKKVVEHNQLIKSLTKMDTISLKLFEFAVAHIDVKNPPKNNTVRLKKSVLFTFFNVGSTSRNSRFKAILENLHAQTIFYFPYVKSSGNKDYELISAISKSRWNNYDDFCEIKFTDDIMPFLIELKANFTQYLITDIMNLESKYSVLIYRWLTMNYNQFEAYNGTGKRSLHQLDQLKNPYISMQEIRDLTDTNDKYKRMHDYEKNILHLAQDEINEKTHFSIQYKKKRENRRVVGVQFFIEKNTQEAPLPYKEGFVSEKNTEDRNQALYTLGMQSEYTKILSENLLLNIEDMQNIDLIVALQLRVYPKYDDLKSLKDIEAVSNHINYVSNNKIAYFDEKKNIVKYLEKSINQYIVKVKLQELQ